MLPPMAPSVSSSSSSDPCGLLPWDRNQSEIPPTGAHKFLGVDFSQRGMHCVYEGCARNEGFGRWGRLSPSPREVGQTKGRAVVQRRGEFCDLPVSRHLLN